MPVTSVPIDPYLEDSSGYHGEADQVFLPVSLEELREVVQTSSANSIPLTVAGAGTGLTGARVPHGGHIVSLERFRKIEIGPGRARCGAGVVLSDLQKAAAQSKQFFGPNPTEDSAAIGGIIATNAGGARSFHYGSVRRHVLALEVTFLNGRTERFERGDKVDFSFVPVRTPETTKNAAGYSLHADLEWVDLLAGSEGTLGIVTEAELQLLPEPAAILSGVVFFPDDTLALDAVAAWRPVSELRLLEFLDKHALDLLRTHYSEIPVNAGAALLVEQNLTSEEDDEVDAWTQRLKEQQAFEDESWFGFRAADRERFRKLRHTLPVTVVDRVRRNGFPKFGTDYAVPLRHERKLYEFYKQRCEEVTQGQYTIFGHAGDANNHVNLLPQTPEQAQRGSLLIDEFAEFVVSLGGTIAAEHGVGKLKSGLLKLMYSSAEIEAMKDVKRQLDPQWLLGQGTIFDR
ncbi:MAG TPA: FAD-binding oxidoreductase [Bryobacteraceae bacterium]|nr:FAD-binding oxidoreductase [Bryobacteraceae bacterium]